MIKKKYHLITSSNELTWKFDRPVVFLGEWCRLFNKRHVWQNMDAIVAKPYGLEGSKKDADFIQVEKLKKKFFCKFYEILNNYHGIKHGERFWQIVVGHWFNSYVNLIFKKFNTLKLCLETYDISSYTCYTNKNYNLATLDYGSFIYALDDKRWNDFLTIRILSLLSSKKFPIEFIEEKENTNDLYFKTKILNKNLSLRDKFFNFSHKAYSFISNNFVRENDAFVIKSFLPTKEEIELELALGQWPQIWKRIDCKIEAKYNLLIRQKLTAKIVQKSDNNLEKILNLLIFELLPICYLEGFKDLKKNINKLPWPKSPKFIFTSSNFHTDEIFKLWSAFKVENGSKYYIGQHGNNYYTLKNFFPRVEEKTADKFFTWGWSNGLSNFKPAFIFKLSGKKKINYNLKGGILLIEKSINQKNLTWNAFDEFGEYFNDQINFVNHLDETPRKNLTIRLSPDFESKSFNEDIRWLEFDPSLKIDFGKSNIYKLISENRLIIHSYDSTGILETLSKNIPTLIFWQNDLNHLRNKVKPDYQILADVGILHFSAKSVADKVNEIWDDVGKWWNQYDTQEAKNKFCDKFAKNCNNPGKKLASLLVEKEINFN